MSAPDWLSRAADLTNLHGLTFYDAAWAAAAESMGIALVSADRRLLAAGLAESATGEYGYSAGHFGLLPMILRARTVDLPVGVVVGG